MSALQPENDREQGSISANRDVSTACVHRAGTVMYCLTVATSAQSFLRGQLRYMAAQGWDVLVAASASPALAKLADAEGVRSVVVPTPREIDPMRDLVALFRWARVIAKVRPDVVNVSTPKAALIAGFAARMLGVPRRVYVVRGLRYESATGPKRLVLMASEWATASNATEIVAVSESVRRELYRKRLVSRAKPVLLFGSGSSNGVDAARVALAGARARPVEIRAGLSIPRDSYLIAFVGRLCVDKGVRELAEALLLPGLQNAYLLTIGTVEDREVCRYLEKLQNRWRHQDHTEAVAELLAASDVLALPTYREGFPNVVLEAAALAVPAVTTLATGARDSVINGVTGLLVPVGNSAALAGALIRLQDPEIRGQMGRAAHDRVLRSFAQEVVWRGLEGLYRGSVDGG
ncbi:glycosyltransferase family 4 protein [Actinotalea ferrariae]|uniref:glycosyltransferase family 4 protein n=1 Tax=Actinotalea ferrariae TaxID=1386098 RepID=UPI0012DE9B34|nr:glycosyltransferase family 4 protein [Actinotalea ferrariae]